MFKPQAAAHAPTNGAPLQSYAIIAANRTEGGCGSSCGPALFNDRPFGAEERDIGERLRSQSRDVMSPALPEQMGLATGCRMTMPRESGKEDEKGRPRSWCGRFYNP